MSRMWEMMEGAVEYIVLDRRCQNLETLHGLEKKTNTTSNRDKVSRTNKLHCRGDAD